ncbi:hypothetical protein SMI01S_18010 [Sphingobacterium mizutaii NBRC 14946 = DSM 11724]|uniref:Polysaccharide biosynthesis protein n=2 Tax=Sphingobacterium mizutaii TaxID=1010 RepID=A0AAJ4XBR6_9SPHI|nr:O-unit flippase-like protein [Sphingobacterium mizutaii]GEM68195.1 hypothetical protein SMI01S_18010 [Sphingobacterium mizutaii NBRC 14946 = DSM 11724]SDL09337.1 Membrane protein involved in the export of O-antigen and teichoic acid [Sphingobacterium mizutaii]SNV51371.1 Polysaccharide biosynthesis protein [Sphingobacterium mizutaii]
MGIKLTKKDVIWSYLAQFFGIASGIFILPIILRLLSTEEIALNYLIGSLGAMVALFDFGFAPQFGRNITYVFSGAQEIQKKGIQDATGLGEINYHLLANMIHTAKFVYLRIAIFSGIVLCTLGTWYIYSVTNRFTSVDNVIWIWVFTIISIFLSFYFSYFDSLLIGRGLIRKAKIAGIISKIVYILLAISLLFMGYGLFGVVISSLCSTFIYRLVSYRFFYDRDFREKLRGIKPNTYERKELFKKIWHNSSRLGLVFISAYAINNLSMFLAGLYLSSEEVASYGLLIQLVSIIGVVAGTLINSYNPTFASLRISGKTKELMETFSFALFVYLSLFIMGATFLIFLGPIVLEFIGSNAVLPNSYVMMAYCLVVILENNHSNFGTLIVTKNEVPFLKSSLIAGVFVALGDFLVLNYLSIGVLGLILVQGIVQLAYANWKWPLLVCQEFSTNYLQILRLGYRETILKVKLLL